MTLRRQLIILVILLFVLMFTGTFFISMQNTYNFVLNQLSTHAQDTATSLGLSISQAIEEGDITISSRMVDAIFDSGFYRWILVDHIDGKVIVDREQEVTFHGVPDWFIKVVPIETPVENAFVMSGLRRLGNVKVAVNPGYAYLQLWQSGLHTFIWFIGSALVSLLIGFFILNFILRPLRAVCKQADAICNQDFVIQGKLPWTQDLQSVVLAMNRLSKTMKRAFEEAAALTQKLRQDAYTDSVTGLGNRRYFDQQLQHILVAGKEVHQGALMLLELHNFKEYNDKWGYESGDTLLRAVADILISLEHRTKEMIVSKIQGASFAILVRHADRQSAEELAEKIISAVTDLKVKGYTDQEDIAHMGVCLFQKNDKASDILACADAGLRGAQTEGMNLWRFQEKEDTEATRGVRDWASVLKHAIEEEKAIIMYQEILSVSEEELPSERMHYEALLRLPGEDNTIIAAGAFLPMAERLDMMPDLDKLTIQLVLAQMQSNPTDKFAVNLSISSLENESFMAWLRKILLTKQTLVKNLTIELPEYSIINHVERVKDFSEMIVNSGSNLAIDHFGKGFSSFAYLRSLHLQYVKIDGSFIRGIDHDIDNQFYVQSLTKVAHGLGIKVIAETVETEVEKQELIELHVDGIQGYLIGRATSL